MMKLTPLQVAARLADARVDGSAPLDHEVADLIRKMHEALTAATAYVELSTGNGCREAPPAWAIEPDGSFNAEAIAKFCRATMTGE